jgi:hypothetical protein
MHLPGVGTNRYAYSDNFSVNKSDPSGHVVDIAVDAASLAIGVNSLASNLAKGDFESAVVDVIGIAVDAVAATVPGVAVGAGIGINAARAATVARAPQGFQNHHIVPRAAFKTTSIKSMMEAIGFKKNSQENIIALPTKPGLDPTLPVHRGFDKSHRQYNDVMIEQLAGIAVAHKQGKITNQQARQDVDSLVSQARANLRSGDFSAPTAPRGSPTSSSAAKGSSSAAKGSDSDTPDGPLP